MSKVPLQPLSAEVLDSKYRLKDKQGNFVEDAPDGIFRRLANALASVEKEDIREHWEKEFYKAIKQGAFPGGRIVSNAGAEKYKPATSLINCTVSGNINDSMESILQEVKDAGITLKAGCGIGYNFSTLRPKGAFVAGVGAQTSGPLSFMDIYDKMCSTIASAGGRRGAQMATFDIRHPDVMDFIKAKREDGKLRKFNMSVLVTDNFMKVLKAKGKWYFYFPISIKELKAAEVPPNCTYDYWTGYTPETKPNYKYNDKGEVYCKVYDTIQAEDLWNTITDATYNYSEPGVIFVDHVNDQNNLWFCEEITATNPCGEVPLPPHGSCLLGSVNLVNFVKEPFTENAEFDFIEFRKVVRVFTRMLDNVVELSGLPLQSQKDELTRKRRHGMGVLGLGSALAMLCIRYGSEKAVRFTGSIMINMVTEGWESAYLLSKEKGPAPVFEEVHEWTAKTKEFIFGSKQNVTTSPKNFKGSEYFANSKYIKFLRDEGIISAEQFDHFWKVGPRFSHHTAIAPTGTLALTLGNNVSGGIEPSFSHQYFRNLTVAGKKTRQQEEVLSYEFLLYKQLIDENATVENLPDYFVSADEVTPKEHLDMQAAAQKYVDQSISKTINVPEDTPIEEFRELYLYGYVKGVKGTTTFRYNPEAFSGVLTKKSDLENTTYQFTLEDGTTVEVTGDQRIEYEGEEHNAAMLFDAMKEGDYHSGY